MKVFASEGSQDEKEFYRIKRLFSITKRSTEPPFFTLFVLNNGAFFVIIMLNDSYINQTFPKIHICLYLFKSRGGVMNEKIKSNDFSQ